MYKVNHFLAQPTVNLTPVISARELIPPTDGQMSSHKIWIPKHAEYPPHYHPAPHIIVILEGGGWGVIGDEERFRLEAGDVFYVPASVPHQVGADVRGMIMLAVSVGSLALTDPKRLVVVDNIVREIKHGATKKPASEC